ncbi:hypothetical protein B0H13DRAFT_1874367 [Mycena leptocephala]|nr:hypothetical protein B0H13DRAFT_1874367 [Mycena leptocephala]
MICEMEGASKCINVPCAETPRPYCPAPPQLHAASVGSLPPTNLVPHRVNSSAGGPPTLAPLTVYVAMCIKTYTVIPAIFRPAAPLCIVTPLVHVMHLAQSPSQLQLASLRSQDENPRSSAICPWPPMDRRATIASAISDALSPLARTPRQLASATSLRKFGTRIGLETPKGDGLQARPPVPAQKCRRSRMPRGRAGGKRRQLGENIPTFQASAIPGTLLPSSHAHPARNG